MDEYYRAIRALPCWLARPLEQLPSEAAVRIHELRLRTGHGVSLTLSGRQYSLEELPECPPTLRDIKLTPLQMEEIFQTLCGGSVHTHQMELSQGFLTTSSGCRVGIAGRFADKDGQLVLQQVTSLNFRVAREISLQLPEKLLDILKGQFIGMLIIGEPDSGKTTLLRQIVEELSRLQKSTVVLDERCEMFPQSVRKYPFAVDVLTGVPKEAGIQMALRTLSPQVILLDELGSLAEIMALEQGFFSGVDFIASIHASSLEDALHRPQTQYLKKRGMLHVLVLLQGRTVPGQIKEVHIL